LIGLFIWNLSREGTLSCVVLMLELARQWFDIEAFDMVLDIGKG